MSVLSDYAEEEQRLLLRSLSAAAIFVSASSPGRKVETASEGVAAATYVLGSRGDFLDNALIGSILFALEQRAASETPFPDFFAAARADGAREEALATLRAASALLGARVEAEEATGFRQWLLRIAQATAEGGKEGGNFLGWGAIDVNDAERAALRELSTLLGLAQ